MVQTLACHVKPRTCAGSDTSVLNTRVPEEGGASAAEVEGGEGGGAAEVPPPTPAPSTSQVSSVLPAG